MKCLALPCLVFFLLELLRLVLLLGAAARPQPSVRPSDRPSDRRHHHDNPSICIAELFLLPISLPLLLPSVAVDAATPFIEIIFQDAMRCNAMQCDVPTTSQVLKVWLQPVADAREFAFSFLLTSYDFQIATGGGGGGRW